jgi:hypothetical protein
VFWKHHKQRFKNLTGQKEEKSKGFLPDPIGSNIGNRQLGDCDPTPLGGRTQNCLNIRY